MTDIDDDKIYLSAGVYHYPNKKRLHFESDHYRWLWVSRYLREHDYKFKRDKPFSTKIYLQIRNVISPKIISSKDLYAALGFYTTSINYLKSIRAGAKRWNLYGRPDGKVTEKEADYARDKMFKVHSGYLKDLRKSRKKNNRIVVNNGARNQTQNKGKLSPKK